jgi:hypothetical protein
MSGQRGGLARHVVARGSRWARACGHRRLGTEHLVGGLVDLAYSCTPPAGPLVSARIAPAHVQAALFELCYDDVTDAAAMLRFTQRAAAALRATSRIADAHGQWMVTADHVLAAVVADRGCRGAQVLGGLGVDVDDLAVELAVPAIAATRRPVS